MAPQLGKCPGCDSEGAVGQPCDEKACLKRGHHYIPDEFWEAAHERPEVDVAIGQVVGDFLVVGFLGSGGFGKVFLALQQPLHRLRGALKLLEFPTDNVMLTEALLEKFQGEAEALADLSHPNIVRLLKYGTHGERPYLVMEFVDQGRTLRDEIWQRGRRRRNFTHFEIQHIIRQVLNGLEAAHDQAIIHRDIKPENIMLQKVVGNANHVRILDFGTAKFVENQADTKWPLGSPSYMAPEQVDLKNIGPWSDLYAVGVLCFEMLIGRRPFTGETDNEIVSKKLDPDFDPLASIAEMKLPKAVETFFARALERQPEDRFQDVRQFRAGLYRAFEALSEEGRGALAEEGLELSDLVDSSELLEDYVSEDVHVAPTRRPEESDEASTRVGPPEVPAAARSGESVVIVEDESQKETARYLWWLVALIVVLGVVGVIVDPFAAPSDPIIAEPDAGLATADGGPPIDVAVATTEPDAAGERDAASAAATATLGMALEAGRVALAEMPPPPMAIVGAGKFHTCALDVATDAIRCWGSNYFGELGTGNGTPIGDDELPNAAKPIRFEDGAASLAVSGDRNASFACILDRLGAVRCWGSNHNGQLGIGNTESFGEEAPASAAQAVALGAPAAGVGVGAAKFGSHACALLESGKVRCWGDNKFGQLGYGHKRAIGDDEPVNTVGFVPLGGPANRIWVGKFHNCAELAGGIRCWGWNANGQLGDAAKENIGDNEVPSARPLMKVGGLTDLALGRRHSCALFEDGSVRCWGWNNAGQLGYGHSRDVAAEGGIAKLEKVAIGGKAKAIVAGGLHTCALLESGKVRCWGDNKFGQLGYGHTRDVGDDEKPGTAGDVFLGGDTMAMAAGSYHTCAVMADAKVRCWGYNKFGQLGYGHTDNVGDNEVPASAGDVAWREGL